MTEWNDTAEGQQVNDAWEAVRRFFAEELQTRQADIWQLAQRVF